MGWIAPLAALCGCAMASIIAPAAALDIVTVENGRANKPQLEFWDSWFGAARAAKQQAVK